MIGKIRKLLADCLAPLVFVAEVAHDLEVTIVYRVKACARFALDREWFGLSKVHTEGRKKASYYGQATYHLSVRCNRVRDKRTSLLSRSYRLSIMRLG